MKDVCAVKVNGEVGGVGRDLDGGRGERNERYWKKEREGESKRKEE